MKIYSFVPSALNDKITRKEYVMEMDRILIVFIFLYFGISKCVENNKEEANVKTA